MKYYFNLIFLTLFFIGCSKFCTTSFLDDKDKVFLKITQKFEGDSTTETEIIYYNYDKPEDKFWSKAVIADASGDTLSVISRKLHQKTRMPIAEFVEELGEITESYKVVYSAINGELLLKDEYEGNFNKYKIKSTKFDYNNGVLSSRTVATYSDNNKFKNKFGNNSKNIYKMRFFPPTNTRPIGNFETDFYFDYRLEFDDNSKSSNFGKTIFEEKTEFDSNDFPIYHSTSEPGCAHEGSKEWFDYKLDSKGRIIELKAYDNLAKTELSEHSSLITYNYDNKGFIQSIIENKYSLEDKDYTKFHDLQLYEWLFDKNGYCYDYNFTNEHYCLKSQRHSLYQKKVMKKLMTKVVEEYFDAYKGDYNSQKLNPKLFKKTTYFSFPAQFNLGKNGEIAIQ